MRLPWTICLVLLELCKLQSSLALTGLLKPDEKLGQLFTFPADENTAYIMVVAQSEVGGDVDLRCRPQAADAAAGYAWQTRLPVGVERLFISTSDDAFQKDKTNTGIYCMVENTSTPRKNTTFELNVVFFPDTPKLRGSEKAAMKDIFDRCCVEEGTCGPWKALTPEGQPGPFVEFCAAPKQGCDGRGRLLQLNMEGWGLKCPLPADALVKLASLQVLRLGTGHQFSGDVAATLDTISNLQLEVLHISGNPQWSGSLVAADQGTPSSNPGFCSMCQKLTLLQLANNSISGGMPDCLVDGSSSLMFIDLGMNQLTGPIPDKFWFNSALTDLFLDKNQLAGPLPNSIGDAPFLHTLNVSENAITGSIPSHLGDAASLMQFFAAKNQLSGPLPNTLGVHPNMTSLDVSANEINVLPDVWYKTDGSMKESKLGIVKLANNNISGPIPAGLAEAPQLSRLNLAGNNFSGSLPTLPSVSAAPFPAMLFFNVSGNALSGSIPDEYGDLRMFSQPGIGYVDSAGNMKALTFIMDLSHNQLSGSIPDFLNKTVVENALGKQWLTLNLADNDFSNKCDEQLLYLDLCRETTAAPQESSSGLSGGAIAGITVGCIAAVTLLLLLTAFILQRSGGAHHVKLPKLPSSSVSNHFERLEETAQPVAAPPSAAATVTATVTTAAAGSMKDKEGQEGVAATGRQ